jgi:hypothetical protein
VTSPNCRVEKTAPEQSGQELLMESAEPSSIHPDPSRYVADVEPPLIGHGVLLSDPALGECLQHPATAGRTHSRQLTW